MKKKLSVLILCFTFVISAFFGVKTATSISPVQAETTNLLLNGDFSSALSSWNFNWTGNSSVFKYERSDLSYSSDNSGSLKITNTEITTSCVGQSVTMEAGKTYVVSAFIKVDNMQTSGAGGTGVTVTIESAGFNIGNQSKTVNNTNWVYYEGPFTPTETKSYRIDCRLWGAKGTVYFDNVCVEERTNYLNDPTFLNSLQYYTQGWAQSSTTTTIEWSSESCVADGSGSMKITNQISSATQRGQTIALPLQQGVKYVVSGYIKIEQMTPSGAGGCGAFFSFGDNEGFTLGVITTKPVAYPTPWRYFEIDFIPKETKNYTLFCRLWGASGVAYFDNLGVREYKEIETGDDSTSEPDRTFTPIAVRTLKKTGIYTVFGANPKAAAPKNALLVVDGEITVDGQEYYRVIYADDNVFNKFGYVSKSMVEYADAPVYKVPAGTVVSKEANATAFAAVDVETYAVGVSEKNGYIAIIGDVQSIVPIYVAKNAVTAVSQTAHTQQFNLTVNVSGQGGRVGGIQSGVTSYAKDTIVEFVVLPEEGYTYSFSCSGGILTKGQKNYALVMTENAVIDIEFISKLNRELYPFQTFTEGDPLPFDYTWISGTTYHFGATESATADGSGSYAVTNVTATHTTLNYMVELTAHTTYVLKGKVKGSFTNPGSAGGCGIFIMVEGCCNLGEQVVNGTREINEWKEYSREFTPTSTGRYSVNIRLWGVTGTIYFDEISLIAVAQTEFTHTYTGTAGGKISSTSVSGTYGESVSVMAIPNPGYKFTGWTDGVTTPYRTDVIFGNATFSARFAPLPSYSVSYKAGEGGIVAGKTIATANEGSYRTMVAVANSGYVFTGWSDGVKTAMRTDYITGPISVTANFAKIRTASTANAVAPTTAPIAPVHTAQLPELPSSHSAILPERLALKKED